jgi:hypothetical protein
VAKRLFRETLGLAQTLRFSSRFLGENWCQ